MLRYKANKQAFIIAVLIILLCLTCLIGATLALFTNDPNDGTIGVVTTSGQIQVDIIDAATGESLIGKVLKFQIYDDREEIYFEPGATYCTQGFKVSNEGNIPINFRLYVSEDEDLDMEEFRKAFDIWISTSPDDVDNAQKLTEFTGELGLENRTTDETYYLFVKMKETAGNEFQKQKYSGIGITVYAVQGNVDV